MEKIKKLTQESAQKIYATPTSIFETKFSFFTPYEREKEKIVRGSKGKLVYDDGEKWQIFVCERELTQLHRNILDIIIHEGETLMEAETNYPVKIINTTTIQKKLGYKTHKNHAFIDEKIWDLNAAIIKIRNKQKNRTISLKLINMLDEQRNSGEKRTDYKIYFTREYMTFLESTYTIGYQHFLADILSLEHAQTQAIVRHILTSSRPIEYRLSTLFGELGIDGGEQIRQKYMRLVVHELREKGNLFGIEVCRKEGIREKDYANHTLKYTRSPTQEDGKPEKKVYITRYLEGSMKIDAKKNVVCQKTTNPESIY